MLAQLRELVRFRDLLGDPKYAPAVEEIQTLYRDHPGFREDVHEEVDAFVKTVLAAKPQRYDHFVYPKDIAPLVQYLIEEVGVYLALFREGVTVEVFPGNDSALLVNLAAGRYSPAFLDYSARTHVSLAAQKESVVNE